MDRSNVWSMQLFQTRGCLENDDLENDDLENDDRDGVARRIKRLERDRNLTGNVVTLI